MTELPKKEPDALPNTQPLMLFSSASPVAQPVQVPSGGSQSQMGAQRILDAVRYWWKWALPAGIVLGLTASAVVYALFRPQYQASAWLRIEDHVPYLAFEAKEGPDQSKGFVQTQIELLRSPMVVGPVVAEPQVAAIIDKSQQGNAVEWLRKEIAIKSVGNSELYTVSFTCPKPQASAQVVNAILDSYFRLRAAEQSQRVERVIRILELERDSRSLEVENLRKAVRELAKDVTGSDPFLASPEPDPPKAKSLADLANRLISTEVEESVLRAKFQVLESIDANQRTSVPDSVIERTVVSSPEFVQATNALAEKKSKLSLMEDKVALGAKDPRYQHPRYQQLAKQVAESEQELQQLKLTLRAQLKRHMEEETASKWGEELASLRSELENQRMMRELLKERYETELASVKQNTGDTVTLRFKQEELLRAEKVYDLISERIVKLRTEKGAPPRVWEMKRADVPVAPVAELPYMQMLLALAAGLVAPFGLAFLKDQLTLRVSDASFVEQHTQLALLGEITRLPTRGPTKGRSADREQLAVRMFEESVDSLRNSLLLGPEAESLRMVTITSAVHHEGKTSIAVQLAVSIARASRQRTLIIDGDMRAPSLHTVFQISQEPGLAKVLAGTCSVHEAIQATWAEGVDVLPAGVLRGNPHALAGSAQWKEFIGQIPAEYRYVIVDTPPVLAASEALVMAREADAVLLCAMRDVTRLPQLKRAADRVAATGAKMAGLVLNGVPTSHYTGRYGNYPYLKT